ncbi:MAG: hypothetical protein HY006_03900 [Candidatus Sungbacteria bacterium]|nr:hypothetical protein [Candidatus Sungbacteria bacterium]
MKEIFAGFVVRREATPSRRVDYPPHYRTEFFSKYVRAMFRISHHKELCKFFAGDKSECPPRREARLASISPTKSHGSPNETETFIRL